jgi:opacity protein-like surface antigen
MKKLFVSLMLVFLVSSFSFAQINKNWDGTKPEVYKGSKNFIFMYSPFVSANLGSVYAGSYATGNDTISSSTVNNLYGIGFQYYVSNQISLAIGLNFGMSQDKSTDLTTGDYKKTVTSIGASVDANYHFKSLYSVSPYVGLNANFGMGSTKYEWPAVLAGSKTQEKFSGSSFGAGLNFGFDWYFTPGLSLGGKYTLGAVFSSAPEDKTTTASGETTVKGESNTTFGTSSASIMLNVHF